MNLFIKVETYSTTESIVNKTLNFFIPVYF